FSALCFAYAIAPLGLPRRDARRAVARHDLSARAPASSVRARGNGREAKQVDLEVRQLRVADAIFPVRRHPALASLAHDLGLGTSADGEIGGRGRAGPLAEMATVGGVHRPA